MKNLFKKTLKEFLSKGGVDLIYHKHDPTTKDFKAQTYERKAHLSRILDYLQINCVLDIGANEGQYAKELRLLGYQGYIFSFEPVAKTYHRLKIAADKDPKWYVYQVALGSQNTTKEINLFDNSRLNSFLSPGNIKEEVFSSSHFATRTINREAVDLKTLDSFYKEIISIVGTETECKLFVKLDTQGFDLEVVKGGYSTLQKVLGVQAEVSFISIYQDMPNYVNSLQIFQSLGFHMTNFFPLAQHFAAVEFDCLMIAQKALSPENT